VSEGSGAGAKWRPCEAPVGVATVSGGAAVRERSCRSANGTEQARSACRPRTKDVAMADQRAVPNASRPKLVVCRRDTVEERVEDVSVTFVKAK